MYSEKLELLIDGKFREGSDGVTQPVTDPSSGKTIAQLPYASMVDLDATLAATQKGFETWNRMTANQRYQIMSRAADLIEARKDDIARTLTLENGKILGEALLEVQFTADQTRWYAEEGKRIYGRIVPARLPNVQQKVLKEPVGPVAAFTAWNFPASNAIRKIAGALGAGCSIILKPSEETPGTAVAIARCFQDAGLPDGALNIVFGVPTEISTYLLKSAIIKKVSLTGSTAVGKELLKLSAETVKRCTMELGGHAPVIVYDDADLERTLDTISAAKFRNAGQVCVSPTRFYVQEGVYEPFVAGFAERAGKITLGSGLNTNTRMGPLIAERRITAMERFVRDAVEHGAKVVCGGERHGNEGHFFQPTVLRDVPDSAAIMNEEPFGPLVPIASFKAEDEAIKRANRLVYGLASFVFTRDSGRSSRTQVRLNAGMVGVNHTMLSTPETPFGGVNESGCGSESGVEGLEAYLRTKFVTETF